MITNKQELLEACKTFVSTGTLPNDNEVLSMVNMIGNGCPLSEEKDRKYVCKTEWTIKEAQAFFYNHLDLISMMYFGKKFVIMKNGKTK